MKEFSVAMALFDFLPVAFYTAAAVILMRDLYNKMSKGAFALFAAGNIDVCFAGTLKALYKLLYAAGVCDFEPLSEMFFPVQSIGALLAGIGILAMLCRRQKSSLAAVAPPVFSGTFVFVAFMVAGFGVLEASLCALSVKLKKPALIAVFSVSFVCLLGMGYLSSKNFAEASMNWIAEGVNLLGELLLFFGVLTLHKNGLEGLRLRGGERP